MNSSRVFCSTCVNGYTFPGRVLGAPSSGFLARLSLKAGLTAQLLVAYASQSLGLGRLERPLQAQACNGLQAMAFHVSGLAGL